MLLVLLNGCTIPIVTDGPDTSPSAGDAEVVTRALRDVERFWSAAYPTVSDGDRFTPVRGGYFPYTRTDPPPACGPERGEYQPNAFYCPPGDFIAWDAQTLIPQLDEQFGPLLVAVVMAHEYGHAIQNRLGVTEQPTVVLEQQADCYAGAWVGDALAGRSPAFRDITTAQLDNTVGGLLLLRDQPGTPALSPQAHGNAFDRIRAYQEGVEQGAERCASYRAGNLPVTEVPFEDARDEATGGNLPYERAVNALGEDAQAYWSRTFPQLANQPWQPLRVVAFDGEAPACAEPDDTTAGAFYCPAEDFAAFDARRLAPALYERFGDNAVGTLISDLFARAVQGRRGASTEGRSGLLTVDCLSGTWANDLLTRGRGAPIRLSPGDLDEAVATLVAFDRAAGDPSVSAFDRIAAYRGGVLEGLSACT